MKEELIKIDELSIDFGNGNLALNKFSLSLNKGEVLGIVGESGSGKSLTSLAIMGLLSPKANVVSGSIQFFCNHSSIELLNTSSKDYQSIRGKKIAMIFQEPMTSLNPVIRCGEQVAEALRIHFNLSKKEAKQKTIAWFEEVLLPRPQNIYDSYPHQLSGGQKQRVMIAMAMACEPEVLIADEPTTALDVTVQKNILNLIKKLQLKHKMSVIFISHDLGVVADISDRIVVMYKGEKIEEGESSSIFSNPKMPYTKGLLACRPPLNHRYKRLPTVLDFLNNDHADIDLSPISDEIHRIKVEEIVSGPVLLEVRDLKTHYPIKSGLFKKTVDYVRAVDGVSFSVQKGETLGLVGESGCGKTSLGRTILQLVKASSGKVLYNGLNLCELSDAKLRELRKDIQIIFQDPYSSLNPRICIGEAIIEPMRVHNLNENEEKRKKKAIELLEKVGLEKMHFDRFPHEFSGGQRQRVCIARALSVSPRFIICDESVSALDVSVQAQVLNLLNDLKKEYHFTYIFISHDLSVVKYMSDRMAVMKDGKILEFGVADDIYAKPEHEYTKQLIGAIPKLV